MQSCNCIKENSKNRIKKETGFIKMQGKKFYQETKADPNPELGGQNFIIFEADSDNTTIKFGDIMQIWSYKLLENSIEFKNTNSEKIIIMKIKDQENLIDEYNIVWKLKKNSN